MSIQIIEIEHPLNEKNNFNSRVISYSDFGTYLDDLKNKINDIKVFKVHINSLDMYYKRSNGDIVVHQSWVLTQA